MTGALPQVVAVPALLSVLLGADWLVLRAQSERGDAELAGAWSTLMLVLPLLSTALVVAALIQPLFTTDFGLSG